MTGQLDAIWIKRFKRGPMDSTESATLVADAGIVGNADQGGWRQVTIIERERWDRLMSDIDGDLDPVARRANLLIRGVELRNCRGARLRVGSCTIELRGETMPCERMDEALPGLQQLMRSDWGGGAFGRVIEGGEIRVGDVVVLEPLLAAD
jgi:MOSC domain-containing protein YiiM